MSAKTPKNPHQSKNDQLEALQRQVADLTEALLRERADATNVRRRAEEERSRLAVIHKAAVVRALLPVIDNFDRSLKHVPKDLADNPYMAGVQAVIKQFEKVLSDLGLVRIKTVGEVFNPEVHEAVSMDEAQGGSREIVSDELQSGYMLGDEVIRHAMVKVRLEP